MDETKLRIIGKIENTFYKDSEYSINTELEKVYFSPEISFFNFIVSVNNTDTTRKNFSIKSAGSYKIYQIDIRAALPSILKEFFPKLYEKISDCVTKYQDNKKEKHKCIVKKIMSLYPNDYFKILEKITQLMKKIVILYSLDNYDIITPLLLKKDSLLFYGEKFQIPRIGVFELNYFQNISFKEEKFERFVFYENSEFYFTESGDLEIKGNLKHLGEYPKQILVGKLSPPQYLRKIEDIMELDATFYPNYPESFINDLITKYIGGRSDKRQIYSPDKISTLIPVHKFYPFHKRYNIFQFLDLYVYRILKMIW